MNRRNHSRTRVLLPLLAVTVILLAAASWLAWRTMQQGRIMDIQRRQERQENSAELAVGALRRWIEELDWRVTLVESRSGENTTEFRLNGASRSQGLPLVFTPVVESPAEPDPRLFADAEKLEFQNEDYTAAALAYRSLTSHRDATVRATALARAGRCLRKAGRTADALLAFDELIRFGNGFVDEIPAGLAGRLGRIATLEARAGKPLIEAAAELHERLRSGKWLVSSATYHFLMSEIRRFQGTITPSIEDGDLEAVASTVELVWRVWRTTPDTRGRQVYGESGRAALALWRGDRERLFVCVIAPSRLRSELHARVSALESTYGVRFNFYDSAGRMLSGAVVTGGRSAQRSAALSGLPWTVESVDDGSRSGTEANQARSLFLAFGFLSALIIAASYFTTRAISRELAVARLQSDFVAAVSHEFRSPLASMLQLADLLARGRVVREERKQQFYETLLGEARRLQRLVESLLDFGRMESGEYRYNFVCTNVAELTGTVVNQFQRQVAEQGYRVDLCASESPLHVNADPESFSTMLWNLLDNAVKYSPDSRTVWVELEKLGASVALHVRDRGIGIGAGERQTIFRKFVRGDEARKASIRGTGLGLAMADQIVKAHHGQIQVESEVGRGTTFTVLLPVWEG